MAYCPEDGTLMKTLCLHYNACYDCPECGMHWNYVDGSYQAGDATDCPVHNYCERCREESGIIGR
jgi:hypothetical protein